MPSTRSAPALGVPSKPMGLTKMVSTTAWVPCQNGPNLPRAGGLLAAVPGYPVMTPATVAATCSCRGRLDPLGDHQAACANAGVLASRALTFERAVGRVCQEAGARVARNARLADMMFWSRTTAASKLSPMGFPLWHGSQLAIDATIVSPVTRAGKAQPGADARLVGAARRNGRQTYPELARARRCRLVIVGVEVGGRFSSEADTWLRLHTVHLRPPQLCSPLRGPRG